MWHIWRNKVRTLQMSRQQAVVRNDQIDLKMNHTEQSGELGTFRQRKTDIKVGRLKLWVSPSSFPLFLQGAPKSWRAVLHQRSATCKRTPPWARKRLDFISPPSLNATTRLLPHTQVLWTLTSWDPTLSALSGSQMPFPILCVPRVSPPPTIMLPGSAITHTYRLIPPDTWKQKIPLAYIHTSTEIYIYIPAPKKHTYRRACTSKHEHPVV